MKIISLTWARDEADILESFVRHNASIVDHMVIVLHRTQDNSEIILQMLKDEGISLDVRTDRRPLHHQTECLSKLMHEAAQNEHIDWVVPLDADEFLVPTDETDPRDIFSGLDMNTAHLLYWRTYIPTAQDLREEPDPVRRTTFRKSYEQTPYAKIIIPGKLAAMKNVQLTAGNHGLQQGEELLNTKIAPALALAHFPVRSENQLRRKIIHGWNSVKDIPTRKPEEAFHWKQLYSRCMDIAPMTTEELEKIATGYATDKNDLVDLVADPIVPRYDRIRYLQRPADLPLKLAQNTLPIPLLHPTILSQIKSYPIRPFTIFSHARSGSTNLCRVLTQHSKIHCDQEIFNMYSVWTQRDFALGYNMNPLSYENPGEMLKKFFQYTWEDKKKPIIGFKIFCNHLPRHLQKQWLLEPNNKIILLSRKNMLAAALSCRIAIRTKVYNIKHGETLTIDDPFTIPIHEVRSCIESNKQWLKELRALLTSHGKPFYECTYENYGPEEIAGICEFLGCEPMETYTDFFTKITQPHHYRKIENLSEIIEAFPHENTGFLDVSVNPHTETASCVIP